MKKSCSKHTVSPPPSKIPAAISALAEGMADDFNNILTTVMGACSLIDRDEPANAELLQYVALIRTSAERAAALSDKLMQAGTAIDDSVRLASVKTSVSDKKNITAKVIFDHSGGVPS